MRQCEKRARFIEFLNYTFHKKQLIQKTGSLNRRQLIEDFESTTQINIPHSTAYRIISRYLRFQQHTTDILATYK